MKKKTIVKSLLILLPVLAVGLATTGDSVMVFDPATGAMEYFSYFSLLPYGAFQLVTPLAALLAALSGVLAAVYLGMKSKKCLKGVQIVSMAAAIVAVVPILLPGDVKIVPNVGLPIFMLVQYGVAYYQQKQTEEVKHQEKLPARRIKK